MFLRGHRDAGRRRDGKLELTAGSVAPEGCGSLLAGHLSSQLPLVPAIVAVDLLAKWGQKEDREDPLVPVLKA